MALWQELMAKWEKEEMIDVDNNPLNPDDEPWYGTDSDIDIEEEDPFDPSGEDPVDLFGPWWE